MSIEAIKWEIERNKWCDEARAVLRGIAEMEPWIYWEYMDTQDETCRFCLERLGMGHAPDCLCLRAKALVGEK